MKEIINISTGEVRRGRVGTVLVSNGIGSCIVAVAIHPEKHVGGMAHIMLPGRAPLKEKQNKTKYAEDALEKLLELLEIKSEETSLLGVCLIGAGNVLRKSDDTICDANRQFLISLLDKLGIEISASALGGHLRRTVRFDIETGEVYVTEGDSEPRLLNRWYLKQHHGDQ